jgi:hypothetical protein
MESTADWERLSISARPVALRAIWAVMGELDPRVRELGLRALNVVGSFHDTLLERFPESFAGLYNDGGGVNYVVLTVGDDAALRAFVDAQLREVTTGDERIDAQLPRVEFRRTARSLRQLLGVKDRIWSDREALDGLGITLRGVGVDETGNRVTVFVAPDSKDRRDELKRRYGPDVDVNVLVLSHRHGAAQ